MLDSAHPFNGLFSPRGSVETELALFVLQWLWASRQTELGRAVLGFGRWVFLAVSCPPFAVFLDTALGVTVLPHPAALQRPSWNRAAPSRRHLHL